MTDSSQRWLDFAERVGGPMAMLLLVMVGIYNLALPVVDSAIGYMSIQTDRLTDQSKILSEQTAVLSEMREDLRRTRSVVELDAMERKAETLRDIQRSLEQGFKNLETKLDDDEFNRFELTP